MRKVSQIENLREIKGQEIASHEGSVKRISENEYEVLSQSQKYIWYTIRKGESGWVCNCPDFRKRGSHCKHIIAVQISYHLHEEIVNKVISPVEMRNCPVCGSSNVMKHGISHNKYGDLQRYQCKACRYRFTVNVGFERMHAVPQAITSAMQLYFTQESLRNIQKFLRLQGIKVSHVTVYNWIKKYVSLMDEYLEKIQPKVGDTWRADEVYAKINGNRKYVFALMDDKTRFYLAQEVSETKEGHDARMLFRNAKERAGKKPSVMVTDGLASYHDAFNKEYYSNKQDSVHINTIQLTGEHNNNLMERANGEFRDREKVTRGLKINDSPMIEGYKIYHNFFKPHMGLDNKTPADIAGIEIQGENKWKTVIENATMSRKLTTQNEGVMSS
jgi:transposase-like protein/predicted nucleic acid-binding Zn finger protein